MYQSFYEGSDLLHLPIVAMWIFLALFAGVLVWVAVAGRDRRRFEAVARLPLDEDAPRRDHGGRDG